MPINPEPSDAEFNRVRTGLQLPKGNAQRRWAYRWCYQRSLAIKEFVKRITLITLNL